METQEFYSWNGLKRYLQNSGRLIDLISTVVELEKLPVKDRKIIIKDNHKDVCLQVFIDESTLPSVQPYPAWKLIDINKIGPDNSWFYKRTHFESWQQLIEYISNSKLTHLVFDQLLEQANMPDDKKTIILIENNAYVVLKVIVDTPTAL